MRVRGTGVVLKGGGRRGLVWGCWEVDGGSGGIVGDMVTFILGFSFARGFGGCWVLICCVRKVVRALSRFVLEGRRSGRCSRVLEGLDSRLWMFCGS